MKIKIGNNNKMNGSAVGQNNSVKNGEEKGDNAKKIVIEIVVGVAILVIAGIILFIIRIPTP